MDMIEKDKTLAYQTRLFLQDSPDLGRYGIFYGNHSGDFNDTDSALWQQIDKMICRFFRDVL